MDIEHRVQRLEDRAEIADLIARYGPIVDAGEGGQLAELWSDDGEYVIGDEYRFTGNQITGLTELEAHQNYLAAGCAHMLSSPQVMLDGDCAVAVNHSAVLIREGQRWVADRVSANRWELERKPEGWRVSRRSSALLDGEEAARELLAPDTRS